MIENITALLCLQAIFRKRGRVRIFILSGVICYDNTEIEIKKHIAAKMRCDLWQSVVSHLGIFRYGVAGFAKKALKMKKERINK